MDEAINGGEGVTTRSSGFPGGRVRLPRLSAKDRPAETEIDVVGTAFVRSSTTTLTAEGPSRGAFTEYFTYESLFEDAPEDDSVPTREDPYKVLRVSPDDDWSTIVHAHRQLAKEFHPDRFAEHPPEIRAQADHEIKRINVAYSRLREIHPGAK